MEFLNVLSRDEMRNVKGGSGQCYMSCSNCNNDTCAQWVDQCSAIAQYQLCGPGPAGGTGAPGQCVC